ncbi:hypothetical protein GC207_02970 [bacterium]|nr:hypothetical protein [bacterium]
MKQSIGEFRSTLKAALLAKETAANVSTDRLGSEVDALYLRVILAGLSINQLLKPRPVAGIRAPSVPDPGSIAAIVRSIAEGYLMQLMLSESRNDLDMRELRLLWLDWHRANEMERASVTTSAGPQSKLQLQKLRARITAHHRYSSIPEDLRKPFEKGKRPKRATFEEVREAASKAGLNTDRFEFFYQLTSAQAHAEPFAVDVFKSQDPFSTKVTGYLSLLLKDATAFIAFSTVQHLKEFTGDIDILGGAFRKTLLTWRGVLSQPF